MVSSKQANELKELLINEKVRLEKSVNSNLAIRPAMEPGEPAAELSLYDNHPADMGTEMFDRLKDQAIEDHTETEIDFKKEALDAIENGNYGKCKVCGKDIANERLKVLPYTLYCVDHTMRKNLSHDRPVEEEVLPLHGPDFTHLHNPQYDMRDDNF